MTTFACRAPYGQGGLGRHLAELVEDARERGELDAYYTRRPRPGDEAGRTVREPVAPLLARWTPLRFSPGRVTDIEFDLFDRAVARTLEPDEVHVGFSLQSLRTFRAARARGCRELRLVAPNSHLDQVRERHEEACGRHPIERSWLTDRQCRRGKEEYALADSIVVASDYVRDSFLAAGIPETKLVRFGLSAASRFVPAQRRDDGIFRVVYVGSLTVAKGTALLVDAFSRLHEPQAELRLVGSWRTRAMRRWLAARCSADPRIRIVPGDPLPHLQQADLYVHPAYEEGWGYGPLEALACGVPVVVTEDTGMKELVREGGNGHVVPTGDGAAIDEALAHACDARVSEQKAGSTWSRR